MDHLRASGIGDALIVERGYESVLGKTRLREAGFAEYQQRYPGLLLPVWSPGGENGLYQYRPDNPRMDKQQKAFKYETPARAGLRLDVPPRCRPALGDPSVPLYITEGIKKGDAGATHGLCVVTLLGVWGFRGRNDMGGIGWMADWQFIATNDERIVNIVFDSDVMVKRSVRAALDLLTEILRRKGAHVRHVFLPNGPNGEKIGLDDFLLEHPVSELEHHTVTPTFAPERKAPRIMQKLAPGEDRHLSDVGNAHRLVARHGAALRFCHAWGKWLVFTGARWETDPRGQVVLWAKDTVRAMYREAAQAGDEEQARALAEWAMSSESASRIRAMLELAQSEVPITPDELDRDPWLLNVANGTLDLRDGALRPHRCEDYLTKLAPVAYDPAARCRTWARFLARIMAGRRPLIRFLQRSVGYCLSGDVSEQVLFFLFGVGANGKSTFLNALLGVLGDYAKQGAPGLLTAKSVDAHPTEIADLAGVRLVSTVEVAEGREMAEALVKQITGGDPVKARRMREDFWTFLPSHKIWLAANHKPVIRGTDHAIWRRIRLIPFEVVIDAADRDSHLGEKLRGEYAGILAWAARGCLAWQRDGLGAPPAVLAATDAYRAQMDVLAGFLAERCLVQRNARVAKGTFYTEYKAWCDANGEKYETQRTLSGRMVERGFGEVRATGGLRLWLGVGLLDDKSGDQAAEMGSDDAF